MSVIAAIAKFTQRDDSALVRYIKCAEQFTVEDAEGLFIIAVMSQRVIDAIFERCVRADYYEFIRSKRSYTTIGQLMPHITDYRQCAIVDKIIDLWPDITPQDLRQNWPLYCTFVMERFAIIRDSTTLCPDSNRLVTEYLF